MTVGILENRLLEAQAEVLTSGSSLKQMKFELSLFSALDIMKKKILNSYAKYFYSI